MRDEFVDRINNKLRSEGRIMIRKLKFPIDFDSLEILLFSLVVDMDAEHLILSTRFLELSNCVCDLGSHHSLLARSISGIHIPFVRDGAAFEHLKYGQYYSTSMSMCYLKIQFRSRKTYDIICELFLAHIGHLKGGFLLLEIFQLALRGKLMTDELIDLKKNNRLPIIFISTTFS